MTEVRLPDADARRIATTDLARNLVVVAGAGTGKTSLLVERVLVVVGSGRLELVDLGAITFTEKAAGEMRTRIATALEDLRAAAAGEGEATSGGEAARALRSLRSAAIAPEEVATRSLGALEQLDRATVDTIHGFCSALLRAHPVEAGVDPAFAIDAGERAAATWREVWDDFVANELGPDAQRPELWRGLLNRVKLDDLREIAFLLADFGVPAELLRPPYDQPTAHDLLAQEASGVAFWIGQAFDCVRGLPPRLEQALGSARDLLGAFSTAGLDAVRSRLDADLKDKLRVSGTRTTGIEPEELDNLVRSSRRLLRHLRETDERFFPGVVEALAPFALAARETMLRRGFVTFDGLLALARDLLRDHPAVRRAARARFRMLLVDELQDTDPRQYEIVLLLAAPDASDTRDPFAVDLEPGRLFLVGDPKQSIYRFRGADYGAYRAAVDHVVARGGARLTLAANFRSPSGIVEPVNRLFGGSVWRRRGVDERHQPEYDPIDAVRTASAAGPCTEIWTVEQDPGASADARRDAEGAILADAIASSVDRGAVQYREVTVLFRAMTNVSHYLRPLRERGVPFVVDGGREFLRRPEVGHLLAALGTVADPSDETALLAFLRSPAGGVSDVELADFAAAGGRWDWRRPVDASAFPRLARRFAMLGRLAEEVGALPVDAMVRRVLDETLLLPFGAAGFEGAQRVVNLRKLATAAAELARDGTLSLRETLEAIREGRLADLLSDAPLADDSIDAVRITTIHKMKGLENEWVFLPDLARGDGSKDKDPPIARAARFRTGLEALALRAAGIHNPACAAWRVEHERHEAAEEARVLYVALTRARSRSILIVGTPAKGGTPSAWIRALAAWGYDPKEPPADGATLCDGHVGHRLVEAPATAPSDRVPVLTDEVDTACGRHVLALERVRSDLPPFFAPSDRDARDPAGREGPGAVPRGPELGRVVGIAVHRFLERWRGEARKAALVALADVCRDVARSNDCDPAPVEVEARSIVDTFYDSGIAARILGIEVLGREVPVLAATGTGQVLRGTIDLVGREADGTVVVVDYKTDRETDPGALERSHGEQLRAYAAAVGDALGLTTPARAEIWALRSGTIVPATGEPRGE